MYDLQSLLVGNRNLVAKTNKEVLSKAKVPVRLTHGIKFYNTLASFLVNEKPQNLYLVQLYQNVGDYLLDDYAAVTVSLHQPVYATVCKLSLVSLLHCRELH